MKSGWATRSLGSICEFSNGLWTGKKPPFAQAIVVRNTNFRPHGRLDLTDVALLDVEAKQLAKKQLKPGDIIIEKSGGGPKQPVGRVAYFDHNDGVYSFSNFTSAARVTDKSKVDPEYLIRFLDWCYLSGVTERMQSHSTGIRNLDFKAFKAIEVPLPPLEEQRWIVGVLDEAFAAIATATTNAEKNLANARELFACTVEEVLERVDDCQTMTLLAAADESCSLSYGIVQPGDEEAGGLPIVRPTDLQQKFIELGPLKRIAPKLASAYQRTTLQGDELLLCVRGSTGTLSIATPELAGGNVTRGIVPIRFNPAILSQKLGYYLLLSASVQKQIKAATYGAALMQINIRDLKQLELRVPPDAIQVALTDRLDAVQSYVEQLQANYSDKLEALAALKLSLLHRAFTGELTASTPDLAIA